jgi:hypothetical protein
LSHQHLKKKKGKNKQTIPSAAHQFGDCPLWWSCSEGSHPGGVSALPQTACRTGAALCAFGGRSGQPWQKIRGTFSLVTNNFVAKTNNQKYPFGPLVMHTLLLVHVHHVLAGACLAP